jgi:hypothetical protein
MLLEGLRFLMEGLNLHLLVGHPLVDVLDPLAGQLHLLLLDVKIPFKLWIVLAQWRRLLIIVLLVWLCLLEHLVHVILCGLHVLSCAHLSYHIPQECLHAF